MTEADWLACKDPDVLQNYLLGGSKPNRGLLAWLGFQPSISGWQPPQASERKLWLYACACCRRLWPLLGDERSQRAVEARELYADQRISLAEVQQAEREAREAFNAAHQVASGDTSPVAVLLMGASKSNGAWASAAWAAVEAARGNAAQAVSSVVAAAMELARQGDEKWAAEMAGAAVRVALIRDVFGKPFRPASLDSAWLTWHDSAVVKIAQGIYDECRFDELPILADALTDAGCTEDSLLEHCRAEQAHVRGCWLLDALLGKV